MTTQEFRLSITPLGSDSYWLRTEDVAPGVPLAEAQVSWPVAAWLAQTNNWHTDPLTSLLSADGPTPGDPASRLLLGKTLYDAVFQGRLRDSWLAAQGIAQYSQKILRLRLGFKDSRLQRLPWELLHDSDRPLATGADITFARYIEGSGIEDTEPLPSADQPLRVLMVIAAPSDQERLALRQEIQQIQAELAETAAHSQTTSPPITIELTTLEQPGRAELVSAIEQGQFQMFHYAGHSEVSETGGDLYLVNSQTGLTETLAGEDLAGLLANNHIRLAVLNSCRSAYTASDDVDANWRDQNLVQALVNRGVPGVIAMAERIPDDVAVTFTQLFYRNLKRGYPVDLSLSRARQGLVAAFGSDQVYWMLPILYMHPAFDGYLYQGEHRPDGPWLLSNEEFELGELGELRELLMQSPEGQPEADEIADLKALLNNQEGPAYEEDAAVVSGLLQQLSEQPPAEAPLSQYPFEPLAAPATAPVSDPAVSPTPPSALPASPATQAAVQKSETPPSGLPVSRRLAVGLGTAGAVLGLAAIWLTVELNPARDPAPPLVSSDGQAAIADTPLVVTAIAALNQDETETVLDLGETLLDQGDLEAVEGIILQAEPTQREADPYLAYLEGRWHWQSLIQGTANAGDALRAWERAVEANPNFIAAWVGLGFAQYELGDLNEAAAAWEQAIAIDREVQRDLTGEAQVAQPITINAYAGLAMAYAELSMISVDPAEAEDLRQRADAFFETAIALDPGLLQTYQLGWLWTPVVADWESTIDFLSVVP